jgi:perosamine synthetase
MIPISKPFIGDEERAAVNAVLDSGMLVQGPRVAELERQFQECTNAKHAIAVSNGTAALHVALLAQGIGEGDEVITTPFTFMASVNSILFVGAKPVFVDILPCCFNIDTSKIEAAITSKTKAILPVHLYGMPANMEAINRIAAKHGLAVIQDAAQAVGARFLNKGIGALSTASYSLYATKNIHCAEGGMITTNDDAIADRCKLLRAHGSRQRYHHEILGYNFRLSDLHAAIAIPQMNRLKEIITARQRNAAFFNANISNPRIVLPKFPNSACATNSICSASEHVWHQYTLRVISGDRDQAVQTLNEKGVGSAVFYPIPANKQKHIIEMGLSDANVPIAEMLSKQVLSIPVHPGLSESERSKIVEVVNSL